MAKASYHLSEGFAADEAHRWLDQLIADEEGFDKKAMLWRLGAWGIVAVVALTGGLLAGQIPDNFNQVEVNSEALAQQGQQIKSLARDARQELRQLTANVEILNKDRDRLFARVTAIEQGLDSVTGSIARTPASPQDNAQANETSVETAETPLEAPTAKAPPTIASASNITTAPTVPAPDAAVEVRQPSVSPEAPTNGLIKSDRTVPVAPLIELPRIAAAASPASAAALPAPPPPDQASGPPISLTPPPAVTVSAAEPSAPPSESENTVIADDRPVQRTQFGVDLGSAGTVDALRMLWQSAYKSHASELGTLKPVMTVRPSRRGLQVHLVAGPISNAASAAKLCAVLSANHRSCETTVFEGQALSMIPDDTGSKPKELRRISRKKQARRDVAPAPLPSAEPKSALSALLGR